MRNGTATAQSAKDIQKELKMLKAKLAELADSIQEDVETASDTASSIFAGAPKIAKAYGEELMESALSGAKGLGDIAAKQVMASIKERPAGTLAALVGIGFLAGYLCHRSE